MVTISELSSEIYLIKSDIEIDSEQLLQNAEMIELKGNTTFDLKLGDHGIWILRLIGQKVQT